VYDHEPKSQVFRQSAEGGAVAKVAINGLGRIGRATLKILLGAGAAIATTKALPGLAGRFDGVAVRVPLLAGSIVDIVFVTARSTSRDEVNAVFRDEAVTDRYQGDPGRRRGSGRLRRHRRRQPGIHRDLEMTRVVDGTLVKVMSWYDNEWGFTCQMVREALATLGVPRVI
jgi:glyceraldehyde 3-phosphate dehydrogenase